MQQERYKADGTAVLDVVAFADEALCGSEEFVLGARELRKRLSAARRWYGFGAGNSAPAAAHFPAWSDADLVLVILNPAIIVSDNLVAELAACISALERNAACVLPADPRALPAGSTPDYATRPGFDRFVARLERTARWTDYDGRQPWVFLVAREALEHLAKEHADMSWADVPRLLGERTVTAQHAYVHSYADYRLNARAEMLRLVPADARTLLDVGGGEGNFARTFMAQRGGKATLLERDPRAAEAARSRGVDVLEGDFESVALTARYDCVAFLDVLEHLADPLAALAKARRVIAPGGRVLLSVPNVGHWSVVWDLLQGEFDYQPVGILCNTHLRFYTRRGLERLIGDARLGVERWQDVSSPPPAEFTALLDACPRSFAIDRDSLAIESFHVLARRD